MQYSKTKIFNLALSHLGSSAPLQNDNENHPQAIILNNFYDLARDTVLAAHEWSFANAYKELSVGFEKSPNPNYLYAFKYPNDCISPRAIIDNYDTKEKKCELAINSYDEQVILSNSNPCTLRYTKRVENASFYTPEFVNALSYYLAYMSAQSICGSTNKKNSNLQDYQIAIRKAIVVDARKNEINDQDDTDYTDARY